MCIIQYTSLPSFRPWDASRLTITVPAGLTAAATLFAVRAVLEELGADQPPHGAICSCGEPVVLAPRIPRQMRREQVAHGA